jgi:hypothetical protein
MTFSEINDRISQFESDVMTSIYPFSTCTRIPLNRKNKEFDLAAVQRKAFLEHCHSFNFEPAPQETLATLDNRSALVKKLQAVSPPPSTFRPDLDSCEKTVKYVCSQSLEYSPRAQTSCNFLLLLIHLVSLSACYSAARRKEFETDSLMTYLLIGMTGTSKTRAIELFFEHKPAASQANARAKPFFCLIFL